jgi:hypothetical protein
LVGERIWVGSSYEFSIDYNFREGNCGEEENERRRR